MAFMMPVVKNDWDIYNTRRSRHTSEPGELGVGRARKVSESRSEGPGGGGGGSGSRAALSPHRSAPTMRSLSYIRNAPPVAGARAAPRPHPTSASTANTSTPRDKLHTRAGATSPGVARAFIGCVPCI